MRLQRGVLVAGVPPDVARDVARACRGYWSSTALIAARLRLPVEQAHILLAGLENAGYLERRDAQLPDNGPDEWNTTTAGGALTMASFRKPIHRARAQALLDGVVTRAVEYNADDTKPYLVTKITLFGSYLHADVSHVGDLDLKVDFGERRPGSASPDAILEHARRSGRRFRSFLAEIGWAETELLRLLRNRSGYINLHTEDISQITDRSRVVFWPTGTQVGRAATTSRGAADTLPTERSS